MDEKLRDSLMEWYLRYGGREVDIETIDATIWEALDLGFMFDFIVLEDCGVLAAITPEGIEALKNG